MIKSGQEKKENRREAIGLLAAGILIFLVGKWWGDGAAKPLLEVLGATGILLSPILWRAEGKVSIGMSGLSITLAKSESARLAALVATAATDDDRLEMITRLAAAPHKALAGVIPFISGELASALVVVPGTWTGMTLKDLTFIRQELRVAIVAIRRKPEDPWLIGGEITDIELETGFSLLACGRPPDIRMLEQRIQSG